MGCVLNECTLICFVLCLFVNAETDNSDLLDDYSIIPDGHSEVHGIDASDTAIAIVTSYHLYMYHLKRPVQLIGKVLLFPAVIDKPGFLELKLLSDTDIGYCDSTVCCYCTFLRDNASCRRLNLTFDNSASERMTSVSMAFEHSLLTLRMVDDNERAAILRFDVLETRDSEPLTFHKYAIDLKTRFNQMTMKGFVRDGYSYFIGSSSRVRNEGSLEIKETSMILTRICNNDSTPQLNSRMDQHIKCSYEVTGITAAHYDRKRDQLWLIVASSKVDEVCRFDMNIVHERFNHNWQICLENNEIKVMNACDGTKEFTGRPNALPAYCRIFNRKSHNGTLLCFNNKPSISTGNCEVHQVSSEKFPFGWLEDISPLMGNGLIGWGGKVLRTDIVPEHIYNNMFQSVKFDAYSSVEWIPTNTLSTISAVQYRYTEKMFPSMRHNIAISGNSLFILNKNSVTSHVISCDGFYKTCESIVSGTGVRAPVKCVWCEDEGNQMAVSLQDPSQSCNNKITGVCPAFSERNELQNTTAALLRRPKSGGLSNKIAFQPPENIITPSDEINEKGNKWGILSVLAGVILLLMILSGLIVRELNRLVLPHRGTNRPTSLAHHSKPLLSGTTRGDNNISVFTARAVSSRSKYECGNLFRYIDDNIKIDASHLRLEETIGEGNFGIVIRGTYTCPDGDVLQVACKMLREGEFGVRAFFEEGQRMMKFDHARVIPFIGISLANDSDPIIVTKFMPNGNLLTYLQNNSNTITFHQILEFSMQIAEGMEYLHSKKFVHRDLSARNCLLDLKMHIKIGDFGLSRQCNDENIYLSCRYPKVPFAWASIEALEFGTFTLKGDIWSYGVVLWELMTKGESPSINYTPSGLLTFLKQGKRLYRPMDCPEEFYTHIMLRCWDEDMKKRPSFSLLLEQLRGFSGSVNIQLEEQKENA